jgi:hypothetical protein
MNPLFTGKTSRTLRKLVPLLCGLVLYSYARLHYNKFAYLTHLEFYDDMPPEYRRFMETRDHRYLMIIEAKSLKGDL